MSEKKQNYYVVEGYDFGYGKMDMRVFPYANKAMALAAIPLHYSQFVEMFNVLGWEVEGCCEDDHAWFSTADGEHFRICLAEG